jgi:hypothetical protein
VVLEGLAVTDAPVVVLRPVAGDQEKVVPEIAEAVRPTLCPTHIAGEEGLTVVAGLMTLVDTFCVTVEPHASVTCTE